MYPVDLHDGAEIWKPVVGWEGLYEASSFGRVRSLDRIVQGTRGGVACTIRFRGKLLKHTLAEGKYPQISLSKDNVMKRVDVHRLICRTFHGEPMPGQEAAHQNGVRNDCRASNLRWATPIANAADKLEHGTRVMGIRHGGAKLSEADIATIRISPKRGMDIAAEYGISRAQVSRIRTGKRWAHIA